MNRSIPRGPAAYLLLFSLGWLSVALTGCGDKNKASTTPDNPAAPKEVPRVIAAEAEGYVNDALFAVQVKDFARAEQSLAKAVKLRADIPDWWVHLGIARKKQGKISDARAAYNKALEVYENFYARTKDPQFIDGQLYMHVLLKQEDQARAVLAKALKAHPDHADLKSFDKAKGIEQLMRDPGVIENRL